MKYSVKVNEVKAKDIDDLLPFSDKLPKDLYFNKKNSHNFFSINYEIF